MFKICRCKVQRVYLNPVRPPPHNRPSARPDRPSVDDLTAARSLRNLGARLGLGSGGRHPSLRGHLHLSELALLEPGSRTLENGRRPVSPPTSEPPEASGNAVGQVRLAARNRANGQNAAFAASRALRHRGSRDRHDPKPRPVHDRTSAIDPRPYARMACVSVKCEVADFECTVTGAITG